MPYPIIYRFSSKDHVATVGDVAEKIASKRAGGHATHEQIKAVIKEIVQLTNQQVHASVLTAGTKYDWDKFGKVGGAWVSKTDAKGADIDGVKEGDVLALPSDAAGLFVLPAVQTFHADFAHPLSIKQKQDLLTSLEASGGANVITIARGAGVAQMVGGIPLHDEDIYVSMAKTDVRTLKQLATDLKIPLETLLKANEWNKQLINGGLKPDSSVAGLSIKVGQIVWMQQASPLKNGNVITYTETYHTDPEAPQRAQVFHAKMDNIAKTAGLIKADYKKMDATSGNAAPRAKLDGRKVYSEEVYITIPHNMTAEDFCKKTGIPFETLRASNPTIAETTTIPHVPSIHDDGDVAVTKDVIAQQPLKLTSNLKNAHIKIGQAFLLDEFSRPTQHRVQPGESMAVIASKYGMSVAELLAKNPQFLASKYMNGKIEKPTMSSDWKQLSHDDYNKKLRTELNNRDPDYLFAGEIIFVNTKSPEINNSNAVNTNLFQLNKNEPISNKQFEYYKNYIDGAVNLNSKNTTHLEVVSEGYTKNSKGELIENKVIYALFSDQDDRSLSDITKNLNLPRYSLSDYNKHVLVKHFNQAYSKSAIDESSKIAAQKIKVGEFSISAKSEKSAVDIGQLNTDIIWINAKLDNHIFRYPEIKENDTRSQAEWAHDNNLDFEKLKKDYAGKNFQLDYTSYERFGNEVKFHMEERGTKETFWHKVYDEDLRKGKLEDNLPVRGLKLGGAFEVTASDNNSKGVKNVDVKIQIASNSTVTPAQIANTLNIAVVDLIAINKAHGIYLEPNTKLSGRELFVYRNAVKMPRDVEGKSINSLLLLTTSSVNKYIAYSNENEKSAYYNINGLYPDLLSETVLERTLTTANPGWFVNINKNTFIQGVAGRGGFNDENPLHRNFHTPIGTSFFVLKLLDTGSFEGPADIARTGIEAMKASLLLSNNFLNIMPVGIAASIKQEYDKTGMINQIGFHAKIRNLLVKSASNPEAMKFGQFLKNIEIELGKKMPNATPGIGSPAALNGAIFLFTSMVQVPLDIKAANERYNVKHAILLDRINKTNPPPTPAEREAIEKADLLAQNEFYSFATNRTVDLTCHAMAGRNGMLAARHCLEAMSVVENASYDLNQLKKLFDNNKISKSIYHTSIDIVREREKDIVKLKSALNTEFKLLKSELQQFAMTLEDVLAGKTPHGDMTAGFSDQAKKQIDVIKSRMDVFKSKLNSSGLSLADRSAIVSAGAASEGAEMGRRLSGRGWAAAWSVLTLVHAGYSFKEAADLQQQGFNDAVVETKNREGWTNTIQGAAWGLDYIGKLNFADEATLSASMLKGTGKLTGRLAAWLTLVDIIIWPLKPNDSHVEKVIAEWAGSNAKIAQNPVFASLQADKNPFQGQMNGFFTIEDALVSTIQGLNNLESNPENYTAEQKLALQTRALYLEAMMEATRRRYNSSSENKPVSGVR